MTQYCVMTVHLVLCGYDCPDCGVAENHRKEKTMKRDDADYTPPKWADRTGKPMEADAPFVDYDPSEDADSELVSNPPEEPVDMHGVPRWGQSPDPLAREVAKSGLALVVYHTLPRRVLYRVHPDPTTTTYHVVQFDEYRTPVAVRELTEVEALFHIGQALTTSRDTTTVYPREGEA